MEVPSINLGKIFGTPGQAPAADKQDSAVGNNNAVTGNNDAVTGTSDAAPVVEKTADKTIEAPVVKDEGVTTVEKDVAPAVEHETVTTKHEEKEQTVIDKERHQDLYHTTIQPAKDREVLPEQHNYEETETQVKHVEHDDGAVAGKAADRNAGFENTSTEGKTIEKKTEEPTKVANEEVHQHLHETIQPVIEKETIVPQVTHKTVHVKEIHHDAAVDQGTTVEAPVSVDELKKTVESK